MTDEPHLSTSVSACPEDDDEQISGDAKFKQIHIVKHDNLYGVFLASHV